MDLSHHGVVMGILNVTPDSFSDGGRHAGTSAALDHARQMIAEGAGIVDVGGESTRPGAREVPAEEELARTVPVIKALRREWDGWISIDTSKAAVARDALAAGADIVNDVTGLRGDPEMIRVCAETRCAVVVMHMQGKPQTMQKNPRYDDVVSEVQAFFRERLATLEHAGISRQALCFDPGIGFGKNLSHNLALLRELPRLAPDGCPLLLGVSRKSFIGSLLESPDIEARDWPTAAITASTRSQGIRLHRVHHVRTNVQALRMAEAILGGAPP